MENNMISYLKKKRFDKQLKHLKQKYKDKKVVIYGTGILFNTIREEYDLSGLNIVAVSDRKFETDNPGTYAGYPVCTPSEIKDIKPDCVLVSTMNVVTVLEDLRYNLLEGENIRVTSIVKKSLMEILKEIWS